jgi:ribosomal protein S12 methylthiotransferase
VKQQRYAQFMERAAAISTARLRRRVGQRLRVLVDRVADGVAIARSAGDAPEIDGVVRLTASAATRPGDFIEVDITAAGTYDLEARLGAKPQ